MIRKNSLLWLFLCSTTIGISQTNSVEKIIHTGNEYYKQEQFELAATEYNKAIVMDPANTMAKYNLANALYKQGKEDEAGKQYITVSMDAKEPLLRSKAYYNYGVLLTKQKKLEESIEAYKNALRQNPADNDARENLQKALLELKKKNPPKKKEEKDNKKKQDQQKKKQQSNMSPKEAGQRLKLLEQKEKQVHQRFQKSNTGGNQKKDW